MYLLYLVTCQSRQIPSSRLTGDIWIFLHGDILDGETLRVNTNG